MRTSVEIPDDLYRLSKAEAALRCLTLKFLVEEGLRLVLLIRRSTTLPTDFVTGLPPSRPAPATSLASQAAPSLP